MLWTVIHITSGWAGLIVALMLGRRIGYGKVPMEPHNISLVVLGAALLWVGWFGFNAGSAGAAATNATSAFVATQVATGMAAVTWAVISWAHTGRPSTVGAASGAVAGLVAITPASGFVSPMSAIVIGIVASIVCYAAVMFKNRRKWDDALDTWWSCRSFINGDACRTKVYPMGTQWLSIWKPICIGAERRRSIRSACLGRGYHSFDNKDHG
jgi:ammonium transporter, Amt family